MNNKQWKGAAILGVLATIGLVAMGEHQDNKIAELEGRLSNESVENMDAEDLHELIADREMEDWNNDYYS